MSIDYSYQFNTYKYLQERENAEKQIPVLFQALSEQYTRQASLVSEWMDKMMSIDPSSANLRSQSKSQSEPEIPDNIQILDSVTGYYYTVSANALGTIVNSDIIDIDSVQDKVGVVMSGTKERIEYTSSKVLSDLSNTFADLKGQATMYTELAKSKINSIDVNAIQGKIQSVIGSLKMPNSVNSIIEALPNFANLTTVTNIIAAHAKQPNYDTWNFDDYSESTGDSVLGAITDLFNDIAAGLDKIFGKMKSLADLFNKLWEAGKKLVTNLAQMAFGWLVNDYEQVDGANFGGVDLPVASFKTTLTDFSNMLGQYFMIGGDAEGLVTSKAPIVESASQYRTVNDAIYEMFTHDRIPYGFNPSAYAYESGHLSQWVVDIFQKLSEDLTSEPRKMVTLFLDGWRISFYCELVDHAEIVHVGFFPGGYKFNSYSEAETDGIFDYPHDLSEYTQRVDLNQIVPSGADNQSVITYVQNCIANGMSNSCAMYLHGTTQGKFANAVTDTEGFNMSSALWDSSAPAWTNYTPKEFIKHLKYVDYDFEGKLYSEWSDNVSGSDRVVLNLLLLAARAIVRTYCDTAEHYYGGLAEYSMPIYSYTSEGETHYIKIRGLKYPQDMPSTKWIPYSTVYDVNTLVHVQTDTERRSEWRKAIIGLIVAAAAVAITIKFARAKKKSQRKAALRGMQEYNALDEWSKDPKNKQKAKDYRKAVKKTKRADKIAAFWGNAPTTVSDFASSDTSIIQSLISGSSGEGTVELSMADIYGVIRGSNF